MGAGDPAGWRIGDAGFGPWAASRNTAFHRVPEEDGHSTSRICRTPQSLLCAELRGAQYIARSFHPGRADRRFELHLDRGNGFLVRLPDRASGAADLALRSLHIRYRYLHPPASDLLVCDRTLPGRGAEADGSAAIRHWRQSAERQLSPPGRTGWSSFALSARDRIWHEQTAHQAELIAEMDRWHGGTDAIDG